MVNKVNIIYGIMLAQNGSQLADAKYWSINMRARKAKSFILLSGSSKKYMGKKMEKKSKLSGSIYYSDDSPEATEFRRLAKKLTELHNSPEIKSILITSSVKHEGKSLISAKTAIAMAKLQSSKKTLLIDCDLRRPVIHTLFSVKLLPGLSSLLVDDSDDIDSIIQDTSLDNLKVISSGTSKHTPSQLLKNFKPIMDKCKESFDFIICDTPPVVPVDDVGLLIPNIDGVLLVIMAGRTDSVVVKRATEILADAKAKIIGVALNNFHGSLPYYYDYGYYGYGYYNEKNEEK